MPRVFFVAAALPTWQREALTRRLCAPYSARTTDNSTHDRVAPACAGRGSGTANVLGMGGGGIDPHQPKPHVTARSAAAATIASLTVLAIGLWLAVRYGNL